MHINSASAAAVTSILLMRLMGAGGAAAAPQALVDTSPAAARLVDSEGEKRMIWDTEGSSGYQDLLDERLP